jgi:hypothetical protein
MQAAALHRESGGVSRLAATMKKPPRDDNEGFDSICVFMFPDPASCVVIACIQEYPVLTVSAQFVLA